MIQTGLFLDPEVMKVFILETKEHLDVIEPNLLKLENEPENPEVINDIFRSMHSIKGASSFDCCTETCTAFKASDTPI